MRFNLSGAFSASVTFDASDTDGELDITIADFFPPLGTLPDREVMSITFESVDTSASVQGAVRFSLAPSASFGDTLGQSVPGTATVERTYQLYLPVVVR